MKLASFTLIENDDNYLLVQENSLRWKNHWFLPGGKSEKNESPEQTAKREAKEEIGCDIVALRNHEFNQFPYSAGRAGGQFLQQTGTGDPIRFGEGKARIGQELCGFHLFKGFNHDEEFDEAG